MNHLLWFAILLFFFFPITSTGQSVGDTVVVDGVNVRDDPSVFGDVRFSLDRGDRVIIGKVGDGYYKIVHNDREGWISERGLLSKEEIQAYREEQIRKDKVRRERRKYLEGLRQKGYTLMLWEQSMSTNSADGVSVSLRMQNVSKSKTIKYAEIEWQLYNTVGDPTSGDNGTPSVTTTRFVGPLEPGEAGTVEFENVWYSSVGRCAVIRKIDVEHIDVSSFTYINDLEEIIRYAEGVRLKGDCSYEAQQEGQ